MKDPIRLGRALVASADTFEAIALEFFDKRKRNGDRPWAEATIARNNQLLGQLTPVPRWLA